MGLWCHSKHAVMMHTYWMRPATRLSTPTHLPTHPQTHIHSQRRHIHGHPPPHTQSQQEARIYIDTDTHRHTNTRNQRGMGSRTMRCGMQHGADGRVRIHLHDPHQHSRSMGVDHIAMHVLTRTTLCIVRIELDSRMRAHVQNQSEKQTCTWKRV
jgi:hypothetical protein